MEWLTGTIKSIKSIAKNQTYVFMGSDAAAKEESEKMEKATSKNKTLRTCHQIWKTQPWPRDWKMTVFIPITMEGNAKECSNYCRIALISHASQEMVNILQARLQEYVNWELGDVQAGFRKGRGTRDQIANICWIVEKARGFQKTSASLTILKAFD